TGEGEAVVKIAAQTHVEVPVARRDLVLGIEGDFLDVCVAIEVVELASPGKVIGQQVGVVGASDKRIVRDVACLGALGWACKAGQRVAARIYAGRVEGGV